MFRIDPGLCPICDAPRCGCTPGGPDSVIVLGQRDAMLAEAQTVESPAELVQPAIAEVEPVSFTTSSYKRAIHGPKKPQGRR